jgi:hypothetical protein
MDDHRPVKGPDVAENLLEFLDIVPVQRPDILESEVDKEIILE